MSKNKTVDSIYKILPLFESMIQENSEESKERYLGYLSRICVRFLGRDGSEMYEILKGLEKLGPEANQKQVRRVVFHMINILENEENGYGD